MQYHADERNDFASCRHSRLRRRMGACHTMQLNNGSERTAHEFLSRSQERLVRKGSNSTIATNIRHEHRLKIPFKVLADNNAASLLGEGLNLFSFLLLLCFVWTCSGSDSRNFRRTNQIASWLCDGESNFLFMQTRLIGGNANCYSKNNNNNNKQVVEISHCWLCLKSSLTRDGSRTFALFRFDSRWKNLSVWSTCSNRRCVYSRCNKGVCVCSGDDCMGVGRTQPGNLYCNASLIVCWTELKKKNLY